MRRLFEGDVCKIEQDSIKAVVDKLSPLCVNRKCWNKLQDIIYFTDCNRKITIRWTKFLNDISSMKNPIKINYDELDSINDLEEDLDSEINKLFLVDIDIQKKRISKKFKEEIVDNVVNILTEWEESIEINFLENWILIREELKESVITFLINLKREIIKAFVYDDNHRYKYYYEDEEESKDLTSINNIQ